MKTVTQAFLKLVESCVHSADFLGEGVGLHFTAYRGAALRQNLGTESDCVLPIGIIAGRAPASLDCVQRAFIPVVSDALSRILRPDSVQGYYHAIRGETVVLAIWNNIPAHYACFE